MREGKRIDRVIECEECGQEFAFTAGEQDFYEEKGLSDPKYCLICRGRFAAQERDKSKYEKK